VGAEGGTRGWKLSNITGAEYVRLLKAYDAELQKDSYILGATPFTSGPTPDWENFNMDGLEQYLIEEEPMPTDYSKIAHDAFDQAYKDCGAEGFNPNDAFRLFVNAGMPQGPVRQNELVYYQARSSGVLVVPVTNPQPSQVKLFPPGVDGENMLAAYLANLPNP